MLGVPRQVLRIKQGIRVDTRQNLPLIPYDVHVLLQRDLVAHLPDVPHPCRNTHDTIDGVGAIVDAIRIKPARRLLDLPVENRQRAAVSVQRVPPLGDLLLIRVQAHIIGRIVAREILVGRVRRAEIVGLRGYLRLLRRASNVVRVVHLELRRPVRRRGNTHIVPVNRALLDRRARNIVRIPYSDCRSPASEPNRRPCLPDVAGHLLAPRRARIVRIMYGHGPRFRRHQVQAHRALARQVPLIRPYLDRGATIITLGRVHVIRVIGGHVGITETGPAVLLCHGDTVRAAHVRLSGILGPRRTEILHGRLGASDVFHDLNRACGALYHIACCYEEALAVLINVEGVGAVLADFAGVLGRAADEMLAGHHRLGICEFRIVGGTEIVRLAYGPHHILVHFELLETALAGCTVALVHGGTNTGRLERLLSRATARIIYTALDEITARFHAKRVAIGGTRRVEHRLDLLFLYLECPCAHEGVQDTRIRVGGYVLFHAAAEEGGHIIMFELGGLDVLTHEFTEGVVFVDTAPLFVRDHCPVGGILFHSALIHHYGLDRWIECGRRGIRHIARIRKYGVNVLSL